MIPSSEPKVKNHFWGPIERVQSTLTEWYKPYEKIIDIGAGPIPFSLATDVIDIVDIQDTKRRYHSIDIDFQTFPFPDNSFDVAYCRHTIEDLQNPNHALSEIFRISKRGYIETPSPLIECLRGVDGGFPDYRGYNHHRYIVFSDLKNNVLHCIPKFPIIEHIVLSPDATQRFYTLAENPLYWNNYYLFDESSPPSFVVYRHGYVMNVNNYAEWIIRAIEKSLEYTDWFLSDP